jgi:hypothetical protein
MWCCSLRWRRVVGGEWWAKTRINVRHLGRLRRAVAAESALSSLFLIEMVARVAKNEIRRGTGEARRVQECESVCVYPCVLFSGDEWRGVGIVW